MSDIISNIAELLPQMLKTIFVDTDIMITLQMKDCHPKKENILEIFYRYRQ